MFCQVPIMGYNTWNAFLSKINEKMVFEIADAMVERGFADAGYKYLVIDDGWEAPERDADGRLAADPEKFPHGMKYVGDYIHSKGLKFGIYSCCGARTCGARPASFEHEFVDADTFASWGVDLLKYDNCYVPPYENPQMLYRRMGMALRSCGRDIVYAACNWGADESWLWMRSIGADTYRSTGDISDNLKSFSDIFLSQLPNLAYSLPGAFNDLDMLTVGLYGNGEVGEGCTDSEYRIQFSIWSLFSSPLILGCDVRSVSEPARELLCNRELIRINQDREARPATRHLVDTNFQNEFVITKMLENGEYAFGFYNLDIGDGSFPFIPSEIGLPVGHGYRLVMHDVFGGEDLICDSDVTVIKIPSRDCRVFRATLEKDGGNK